MTDKRYLATLKLWTKTPLTVIGITFIFVILTSVSFAQNVPEQLTCGVVELSSTTSLEYALNNLWVLVAGILVLMMQLGFAMLEAGINAAKNTVNVLFKNVSDACLGILVYFVFGYALMYRPDISCESANVLSYFLLEELFPREGAEHLSTYIDFFFQAAFAATAATICSGAVAGRIKPWAYLVLTFLITGIVYPVSGYWVWGGGWLDALGFDDFAGSLVVHAVGGGAALAVVLILQPRTGRFRDRDKLSESEENHLLPHNLPLAAMGTFILWIGWYGFNAGSTLGIIGDVSSPEMVGKIAVNTTIAACSSAVTVIVYRSFRNRGRIDLSTLLNGLLGGLVGITGSCNVVNPAQSLIIGIVAGLIVIGGINFLFELKIDDAVGAIPVHCFCGIWGGLAVSLLGGAKFGTQLIGSFLIPAWSFFVVWSVFKLLNILFGIRVPEDEERKGLDWEEHGEYAYLSLEQED